LHDIFFRRRLAMLWASLCILDFVNGKNVVTFTETCQMSISCVVHYFIVHYTPNYLTVLLRECSCCLQLPQRFVDFSLVSNSCYSQFHALRSSKPPPADSELSCTYWG